MEKVQARLITPMDILDDEQHRLFAGLTCEELRKRGKEAAFLLFGIRCGQWSQIRRYGHDIRVANGDNSRGQRSSNRWRSLSRVAGRIRAQEIEERSVWVGEIRREAIALEKEEVLGRGVGFRFGHQPRFANACLSAEKDNLSLSPLSPDQ